MHFKIVVSDVFCVGMRVHTHTHTHTYPTFYKLAVSVPYLYLHIHTSICTMCLFFVEYNE